MAGTDVASGVTTAHGDVVAPLDPAGAASPGVQAPTPVTPPSDRPGNAGPQVGDVRDTTGEFQAQMAAGEADCRAAQAYAMDTRNAMLGHYQDGLLPLGGTAGDLIQFPPSALDPGAGVGNTLPTAAFYDPPRGGAPETYSYGGNEPPPGYQGDAQ